MRQKFIVLSKSTKSDLNRYKPIYIRVSDGTSYDWKEKTPFVVDIAVWNPERQEARIKPTMSNSDRELWSDLNLKLAALRNHINLQFVKDKLCNAIDKNWLEATLTQYFDTPKEISNKEIFEEFLCDPDKGMSESRKKQFAVLFRSLQRYEIYVRLARPRMRKYCLRLSDVDSNVLQDLWEYMKEESTILDKFPEIEEQVPRRKKADVRSDNTLAGIFKRFRAFMNWCIEKRYIDSNPFDNFEIPDELYGTPNFLTLEELRKIYNLDLSDDKKLEQQRDIFIFQCNIGCRVGDLLDFKKADVFNGILSFIPDKTIKVNPKTVTVPLNKTAKEIVRKYKNQPGDSLLPFIRSQDYNDSIKLILHRAGINRQVVVLDPVTRTEKKVSISSIASSHMARRTFIGNLYYKVKDPNLISSMTGHSEGSRAFARYRNIDINIKQELVKKLG